MKISSVHSVSAQRTQTVRQQTDSSSDSLKSGQVPDTQSAGQSGGLADSFNPRAVVQKNKPGSKTKVSAEAQHRRSTWKKLPYDFPQR
jgi:hypothetical protein